MRCPKRIPKFLLLIPKSRLDTLLPRPHRARSACTKAATRSTVKIGSISLDFLLSHGQELSPGGPTGSTTTLSTNLVTGSNNAMSMWYPDSGATSHITSSAENIQRPHSYHGNDHILSADGSPIHIRQSGTSSFCSNSPSFILNDFLLVPSATKNLLSINHFCIDNGVCLRYDSQKVHVRDIHTEKILM